MKKLVLTAVASLACVAAFAQGKISFQVDSLHLVYYDPAKTGASLAGNGVSSSLMPAGINLVADLYVGTSSTSLSLMTTTTFGATPGKMNTANIAVPFAPGGASVFVY